MLTSGLSTKRMKASASTTIMESTMRDQAKYWGKSMTSPPLSWEYAPRATTGSDLKGKMEAVTLPKNGMATMTMVAQCSPGLMPYTSQML